MFLECSNMNNRFRWDLIIFICTSEVYIDWGCWWRWLHCKILIFWICFFFAAVISKRIRPNRLLSKSNAFFLFHHVYYTEEEEKKLKRKKNRSIWLPFMLAVVVHFKPLIRFNLSTYGTPRERAYQNSWSTIHYYVHTYIVCIIYIWHTSMKEEHARHMWMCLCIKWRVALRKSKN